MRGFMFSFYNFRITSRSVTHWIWSTKICWNLLARFTLLIIEMKDTLIPSLNLKHWVEVRVFQVCVAWSWILRFAHWEKVQVREVKNWGAGRKVSIRGIGHVNCSELMSIMYVHYIFLPRWSHALAILD